MERRMERTLPHQDRTAAEDRWIEDILRPDPDRPTTPDAAARALQEKLIKFGYLGSLKPSPRLGRRA
jgi:hypothetical protein